MRGMSTTSNDWTSVVAKNRCLSTQPLVQLANRHQIWRQIDRCEQPGVRRVCRFNRSMMGLPLYAYLSMVSPRSIIQGRLAMPRSVTSSNPRRKPPQTCSPARKEAAEYQDQESGSQKKRDKPAHLLNAEICHGVGDGSNPSDCRSIAPGSS